MNTFNTSGLVTALLGCAFLSQAHAAEPTLPRDGWVSWQVDAVDGAPAWCCFDSWQERAASRKACQLDGSSHGYGISDGNATTDAVRVYARTAGGKLDSLQVFAASCPVEAKSPIQELGNLGTDDSARWLIGQVKRSGTDAVARRSLAEGALAALAMHRGDVAGDAMATFARTDARTETRKQAVFWLALLRGTEGADITSSVMFNDSNAELREHAAFALSQSKSPRVTQDLIRLGNTDKVGDVRAKAWFWLAQTKAAEAEAAIGAAIRKDTDDDVREQGIFALSQLPDERATPALIAIAEDRSLPREQRKRAVFWLAQSKSDAALAYLDKVLARNAR